MMRWLVIWVFCASAALAEARIDPDQSRITQGWRSLQITLALSDIVPYRLFTLDDPRRLIIDFQGLATDRTALGAVNRAPDVTDLRFGLYRPGWARLVLDLAAPYGLDAAAMTGTATGAQLTLALRTVSAAAFAASAGAPDPAGWAALTAPVPALPPAPPGAFVVVLDPGHGGIDPGAERGGLREADLMLQFATEIAASLRAQAGIAVHLTRSDDSFVPLFTRMSIARAAGADLFISLHADAVAESDVFGASVYTLSEDSDDLATARLVERHDRGDLLAGVDLSQAEDGVAAVLMDLARRQTAPQAAAFADRLVAALEAQNVRLNNRPRRTGRFSVLLAADFPGVLLEAGFLSNARDRAMLGDPVQRAGLVRAITAAVVAMAQR